MHEDEICGLAADIRRGSRRHRDIGRGERRRIVDTIADHQHVAAFTGKRGAIIGLALGRDFRLPARDAELSGQRPYRPGAIPRDEVDRHAIGFERADGRGGVLTKRILETDAGNLVTVARQHDFEIGVFATGCITAGEAAVAEPIEPFGTASLQPASGDFDHVVEERERAGCRGADRARQRMARMGGEAGC
ncbi:hypothetical protein D3C80_838860 [compost metagenome]